MSEPPALPTDTDDTYRIAGLIWTEYSAILHGGSRPPAGEWETRLAAWKSVENTTFFPFIAAAIAAARAIQNNDGED